LIVKLIGIVTLQVGFNDRWNVMPLTSTWIKDLTLIQTWAKQGSKDDPAWMAQVSTN